MAQKPYSLHVRVPATEAKPEASPELARILEELRSPDDGARAAAVRELCPCRGAQWELPVFQQVLALRSDPSPVVRHAVQHDLSENRDWGARQEARRLARRRVRQEMLRTRAEIDAGPAESAAPAAHSMAWRMPRRPRSRKGYYPRGR